MRSYSEVGERRPTTWAVPGVRRTRTSPVTWRCVHEVNARSARAQLAIPEAVIGEGREPIGDLALEGEQLAGQGQRLEGVVGEVQHDGGRRLVHLAALDPDQPVLDVVDAADAMRARRAG